MRLAVISDVHANLEALEAVLGGIKTEGVDEIVCLGDIVGYGPNPNECCALIRSHCSTVVLGNHDEWSIHPPEERTISSIIWQSIAWTSRCLDESHKAYFAGLPLIIHRDDLIFVHASPIDPSRWAYVSDERTAARYVEAIGSATCFLGHSHVPGIYGAAARDADRNAKGGVIVNVGSVGQPRDGDKRACYAIFDSGGTGVTNEVFRRLEYDSEQTSTKIVGTELPPFFAERLKSGR